MDDAELQEFRESLIEAVRATVVGIMGPARDDRRDEAADARREADMDAARAASAEAFELEKAAAAERARWENMAPDELARLEDEARHRRCAEAVANCLIGGQNPADVDIAGLAGGLDGNKVLAAIGMVADEIRAAPGVDDGVADALLMIDVKALIGAL